MKKRIIIIAACILVLACAAFSAVEDVQDVLLSYDGDAYSIDYVFDVPEGINVTSVSMNDANSLCEWNFLKSEARLYISLASAYAFPYGEPSVTISTDKRAVLDLADIKVNGKTVAPLSEACDAVVSTESTESVPQSMKFSYGVSLSGTYDGFSFEIVPDSGMNIESVVARDSETTVSQKNGAWVVSSPNGMGKVDSAKEQVASVTVSVDETAATGKRELSLADVKIFNSGNGISKVRYDYADIEVTDKIYVTGVSLDKESLILVVGDSETLTATITPSNATDKTIEWKSSDESVATVENGVVTAKKAGNATITVTAVDGGYIATCEVTAVVPVTGVSLDKKSALLVVGDSETLTATIAPSNATDKTIEWKSSDESVATVENGVVTAKKAGNATITVTAVDGGYIATCEVTAVVPVSGISINKKSVVLVAGTTEYLKATISPTNASNKNVEWKSSDNKVATVQKDGKVSALSAGKATITVRTLDGDYTENCVVTVTAKPVPVKTLKFASTKATAYVGNELDLGAMLTVTPIDNTDEITWASSNTKVATVDENGVVTPKATGTAKITAKAMAGKKSASCTVTVAYPPEAIAVTGATTVAKGKTSTLTAYAYYMENGKEKKTKDVISWRSEDESIATVSKGSVKGISAGTTNIIAYIEGSDIEEVIEVTVAVPITSIKFASTKATLYVGNDFDLGVGLTFAPIENNDTITWKSSNEKVATVDEYGVVTPIATGTAKITATAEAGKKTATCTITVARPPEGIVVTGATTIAKGKTSKLTAYAYYMENGKEKKTKDTISWRSEDTSIATVSKGSVKGISAGTTNIIAYIEGSDIEEVIEVTVAVPITSLKLSSTKATLYVGNEFDLGSKLTFAPIDNNDNITWKSSNTKVATVDEYGVVTPIATGTAKITATAEAGKKTATCTVTVAKAPEGIVVTGNNALAQGKSSTLKAYAYYMENGKGKKTKDTISWRSEDPSIVTVSKGKIKGISAGTTNIIAYIEGTDIEEVIEVSVVIPAKTVKLSIKKLTASIGDEIDLNEYLTVTPADNSDVITWTTSKATVATVEDGIVKIVGKGSAKISAKAVAGGKSASVTITVK